MNRSMSLAFLVVGIVLIIMGMNSLDSFSSDVSRFFTGSPTNKAVWLLIGGIVLTIVGMADFFRVQKAK